MSSPCYKDKDFLKLAAFRYSKLQLEWLTRSRDFEVPHLQSPPKKDKNKNVFETSQKGLIRVQEGIFKTSDDEQTEKASSNYSSRNMVNEEGVNHKMMSFLKAR